MFIRWGRSECPADRGTVLVYEGTLVHIYFDYCSNSQNHTTLKGLCNEDINVLAQFCAEDIALVLHVFNPYTKSSVRDMR